MPGIVGIISRRPAADCAPILESMLDSMQHEEFYTSGSHIDPELGVYTGWTAHPQSFAAQQVFSNEAGDITLVWAGESFIDVETRNLLKRKGHRIDHNWLVHLYEEKGEKFVEGLNGLFSGLLIDKRLERVLLFNDRYGLERIYCHQTDGEIYFASEAKALLRVLPETRGFDSNGVAQFLSYGCTLEGTTLFRGIERLAGGSLWSFAGGRSRKDRYFSPAAWESEAVLSAEDFETEFQETFKRVLPRYFESPTPTGISLTGGLDTRMIMACLPQTAEPPICYTFSGPNGKTMDDRLADRVATVCGLKHRILRLESDFFRDFASQVDGTVWATDGCSGPTGAHEIYLNRLARQLAPVRLTGNYGSEILRGISTFKPLKLSRELVQSDGDNYLESGDAHLTTFAAFREIPWNLFGSLAAGRSQLIFRTPYLDNELVQLTYKMPQSLRRSPLPAWHLITTNNSTLGRIPTDRGQSGTGLPAIAAARRLISEAAFKLDYLNNEGWPNWLSPIESPFARVTSSLRLVGWNKYLHYRRWFRRELATYLRDAVADIRARQMPFWKSRFLEQMADDHIRGRKNYVLEINAVLLLGAIDRLFFKGNNLTQSVSNIRGASSTALVEQA